MPPKTTWDVIKTPWDKALSEGSTVNPKALLDLVVDQDVPRMRKAYDRLQQNFKATVEVRMKIQDGLPDLPIPITDNDSEMNLDEPQERYFLAEFQAVPKKDGDGRLCCIVACLTDVTLYHMEAEFARSKAQNAENTKLISDYAVVGMYQMSLTGRLIDANDHFYSICGLETRSREQLAAEPFIEPFFTLLNDEDLRTLDDALKKVVKGQPQFAELQLIPSVASSKSPTRHVDATFMPVRGGPNGDVTSFTGSLADVSLQKVQLDGERRAREEACQEKEQAVEERRRHNQTLAIASHEIRNLLSSIKLGSDEIFHRTKALVNIIDSFEEKDIKPQIGSLGLLETHLHSMKNVLEDAQLITECVRQQECIVDDMITMTASDLGHLLTRPIPAEPLQVLDSAVRVLSKKAEKAGTTLIWMADPMYWKLRINVLRFDSNRVRQMIINLVSNALKVVSDKPGGMVFVTMSASKSRPTEYGGVKFEPPRKEPMSLDGVVSSLQNVFTPQDDEMYLMFKVEDDGPGITTAQQSRLFKFFSQTEADPHAPSGGSGIGLYVCKALADNQGGGIDVASSPETGTTFAFYIKTRTSDSGPEARSLARSMDLDTSVVDPGAHNMYHSFENVLLVDDNIITQVFIRKRLESLGCKVTAARNGKEALQILDSESNKSQGGISFDVILIDMFMPLMDGFECTRRIRDMEREGKLKSRALVVAVTGSTESEERAKAAGCNEVLIKPLDFPQAFHRLILLFNNFKSPGARTIETDIESQDTAKEVSQSVDDMGAPSSSQLAMSTVSLLD